MQGGIDAVRQHDQNAWVMLEPTSLLNAFPYPGDLVFEDLHRAPRRPAARSHYAGHLYQPDACDGKGYAEDGGESTWTPGRDAGRAGGRRSSARRCGSVSGAVDPGQDRMDEVRGPRPPAMARRARRPDGRGGAGIRVGGTVLMKADLETPDGQRQETAPQGPGPGHRRNAPRRSPGRATIRCSPCRGTSALTPERHRAGRPGRAVRRASTWSSTARSSRRGGTRTRRAAVARRGSQRRRPRSGHPRVPPPAIDACEVGSNLGMADLVGQRDELDAIGFAHRCGPVGSWRPDPRSLPDLQESGRSAILLDVGETCPRRRHARSGRSGHATGSGVGPRAPPPGAPPAGGGRPGPLLVGGPAAWAGPLFSPGTAEVDHLAVSQGLISVLGRAGEGVDPLAIVLDDLHLADRASVRVLAEVAIAAQDLPLALVVSVVEGRSGGGLAGLVALGTSHRIDRLDRAAVAELASERLGGVLTEDLLIALESDTGGLPAVLVPGAGRACRAWRRCPCAVDRGCRAGRTAGPSGQGRRAPRRGERGGPHARARCRRPRRRCPDRCGRRCRRARPGPGRTVGGRARRCRSLRTGCSAGLDLAAPGQAALDLLPSGRGVWSRWVPPGRWPRRAIRRTRLPRSSSARRSWASPGRRLHWLRQPPKPSGEGHRRSPRTCGSASSTNPWTCSAVGGPPPRWPERSCTWGIRPVQARLDDLAPLVDDPGLRSRVRFAAARAFLWSRGGRSFGGLLRGGGSRCPDRRGGGGRPPVRGRGAPCERDRRPRRRSGCPARWSATGERWHRSELVTGLWSSSGLAGRARRRRRGSGARSGRTRG